MTMKIDLVRLLQYVLKRIWLPILCAMIGFGAMYYRSEYNAVDTYTASSTLYVSNGNPNAVNYQYTTISDINTSVMLVDTYAVVIRSNKVMDAVAERLGQDIMPEYIASTLSMSSVGETGVMRVSCTTPDPQLSMDICNAVVSIAPAEIVRVVNAGSAEVIDYAELPLAPNRRNTLKNGVIGFLAGGVLGAGILLILFLMNRKLADAKDWTDNYTLPVLSTIPKQPQKEIKAEYLLNDHYSSNILAAYGKLRMNLFFAMHGEMKTILISSAVPAESKSTLSANLAISFALDGKKVLLIDGDMRKQTQNELFQLDLSRGGLSDLLVKATDKPGQIWEEVRPNLDVLLAGTVPPNPSEMLNSGEMRAFLREMEEKYDLILIDTPPMNIVSDALVLADTGVGMLLVVRCGYSDHREIKKALEAAEFSKINMLGVAVTNARLGSEGYHGKYYYKRYYSHYYSDYDKSRNQSGSHKKGKQGKAEM